MTEINFINFTSTCRFYQALFFCEEVKKKKKSFVLDIEINTLFIRRNSIIICEKKISTPPQKKEELYKFLGF